MKLFCFAHRRATPHGLARLVSKRLAVAGLMVLWAGLTAFSQAAKPAVACESLAKLVLPDTTITLAEEVAAGQFKVPVTTFAPAAAAQPATAGAQQPAAQQAPARKPPDTSQLPAFCRVAATIKPTSDSNITMEVWMPLAGWNGRMVGVANAGWAGRLGYDGMIERLSKGYAATSSNGGHDLAWGSGGKFVQGHPERLIDYGYRGIHEMTVKAKAFIRAYYGAPVKYAYFIGCSQGGTQGFMAAKASPEDYDGIVVEGAGNPFGLINAAQLYPAWQIAHDPDKFIPKEKYTWIHQAIVKACDPVDGLVDGQMDDPSACHFDFKTLECDGAEGPNCLTAKQVEFLKGIYAGPVNPRTKKVIFPGPALGDEMQFAEFGGKTPMGPALDLYKYIVFDDKPDWDWKTLDYDKDIDLAVKKVAPYLHADPPGLKKFFERNGKLLIYDGWNDYNNPYHWMQYHAEAQKIFGAKKVENSMKVVLMPDVDHCLGGPGCGTFDRLAPMQEWVEKGKAPERIIASKMIDGKVVRTRPLCAYPQVAKYKGTGSIDEAGNFVCTNPKPAGKK